jgi:hypothetical protein
MANIDFYRYDNFIEKVDDDLFVKSLQNYGHFRYLVDSGLHWKVYMEQNFTNFLKRVPETRREMQSYEKIMLFIVKNGFKVDRYMPELLKRTAHQSFEHLFLKMIPFITTDISKPIYGVSILKWIFYEKLRYSNLEIEACKSIISYVIYNKRTQHIFHMFSLIEQCELEFSDIKCTEYD